MRILCVKLSSLGDVIHTWPAITDLKKNIPDAHISWLIEKNFSCMASMHPGVSEVIPVSLRAVKKRPWRFFSESIFTSLSKTLREKPFDVVVDAQGLIKSALLSRFARSNVRHGYDASCVRERWAARWYTHHHDVGVEQHAIDRTRQLFAKSFSYSLLPDVDFGIDPLLQTRPDHLPASPYLVFSHGTTWASKHWEEAHWRRLCEYFVNTPYHIYLPWLSSEEKARAYRLAEGLPHVHVLSPQPLPTLAAWVAHAAGVIGMDTGITHLAAAMKKPTLGLYGPTDAIRAGAYGTRAENRQALFPCAPCRQRVCSYQKKTWVSSPCLSMLLPQAVYASMLKRLE